MSAQLQPFNLPVPKGAPPAQGLALAAPPNPAIGTIVCATSSINPDGYSVLPEQAPVSLGGRIAFALLVAAPGGALVGFLLAALVVNVLVPLSARNTLATPIVVVCVLVFAGLLFQFSFKRWGRGGREGATVYAGTEGVERVTYEKGKITRAMVRYVDDLVMLSGYETVTINGVYSHDTALLRFLDPNLNHLVTLVGVYDKSQGPDPEALQVREATALAAERRTALASQKLQQGATWTFPIVESQRSSNSSFQRLLMRGDHLELQESGSGATVKRWRRSDITTRTNQGQWEIVPRDPSQAGAVFKRASVSDVDALEALLGTTASRS